MCVCVRVCMCVYVCVRICVYKYVYTQIYIYIYCLVSLFNGISTFVGYVIPKPFSKKNSSGTI